tara:strand:- start:2385 stop:3113 length:729 start_codon:yes stop_codon:yes gene_type:complete
MNPIYFISDIHLSSVDSPITRSFFDLLDNKIDTPTSLYILGDLFEVWIGDDDDSELAAVVKSKLLDFTNEGNKLFFIAGNRDFLLDKEFASSTNIEILEDPFSMIFNEMKVVISHGDFLCTNDSEYMKFREQVRSPSWKSEFLSKPLHERKKIADSMRDASNSASKDKSSEITDVNLSDVDLFLQKEKPSLFIHGHTHRPDLHDLEYEDFSTQRIVLGDWDTFGWCLKLDINGPDLFKFKIQ